ncbi:hypothetical protein [Streptomyces filamentosus]|uniref:hypothetical protein n=1 Tax=Streptomyces filamentosus TaxID=67294 RepID=UPI0033272CFA
MSGRQGALAAFAAGVFVLGGAACGSEGGETGPVRPPQSEAPTPVAPPPTKKRTPPPAPSLKPGSERSDLREFRVDDARAFGADRIWLAWTIVNSTPEKANYRWEWEAVDAQGVRVAQGTELAIGVEPGEKTFGGTPTTLETADVKLRVTKFDRTTAP